MANEKETFLLPSIDMEKNEMFTMNITYTETLHGSARLMLKCHFSHFDQLFQ